MLEVQSNVDKTQLRKEIIKKRKELLHKKSVDKNIIDNVLNCDLYLNSSQILCYVSLNDEIRTDDLIKFSLESGKKVAVPRCIDNDGNMEFYYINSLDDLEIGSFNVREPKIDICKKVRNYNNSLVIVPALAYDKSGYRIGYGKGFYDRFLQNHPLNSLGLCYNDFVLEKIPINKFDKNVDSVITEFGKIF